MNGSSGHILKHIRIGKRRQKSQIRRLMLETSYPVFVQQQSGVIQEARKLVSSDARSRSNDEAAQKLIMIIGEPWK
eukprot:scaffold14630_cov127-Cylindrotheca_fusiformis.AAC.1